MRRVKIKILKKGDEVLSVFRFNDNIGISVKRKKGEVDIVLVGKNDKEIPEISSIFTITEGDNEVEITNKNLKLSSF